MQIQEAIIKKIAITQLAQMNAFFSGTDINDIKTNAANFTILDIIVNTKRNWVAKLSIPVNSTINKKVTYTDNKGKSITKSIEAKDTKEIITGDLEVVLIKKGLTSPTWLDEQLKVLAEEKTMNTNFHNNYSNYVPPYDYHTPCKATEQSSYGTSSSLVKYWDKLSQNKSEVIDENLTEEKIEMFLFYWINEYSTEQVMLNYYETHLQYMNFTEHIEYISNSISNVKKYLEDLDKNYIDLFNYFFNEADKNTIIAAIISYIEDSSESIADDSIGLYLVQKLITKLDLKIVRKYDSTK
jgi:hypothetical protein